MDTLTFSLLAFLLCLGSFLYSGLSHKQLVVPTTGFNGALTSYFSAFRFIREGNIVIREGYQKYKNQAFKVALVDRWLIVITGDRLYESLRTAPDNVLSMWDAMSDFMQIDYTLGTQGRDNPYHLPIIRNTLTKNLGSLLPDILDEVAHAFDCEVDSKVSKDWKALPALELFTQIVCQVSNRVFVGLPVCRNKEYCKLNISFTTNVMAGAAMINIFPDVLKPIVGKLYNKVSGHQAKMLKLLGPEIEKRKRNYEKSGLDYAGKPNDMLTWVMESATPGLEQTASSLALRMLNVNFMTIHSTSVSFTHTVYNLASYPHYAEILRSEIEMCLDTSRDVNAWSISDLDRCVKLDSFLKETIRLHGLGAIALPRKAVIPFTFPDGTVIPVGEIVAVAAMATHLDSGHYPHPEEFDGLRFARLREEEAASEHEQNGGRETDAKYRLTSAGPAFLGFGGGKHICPGRFFGSVELKCMLVHLLLNYDVKMAEEGVRPEDTWIGPTCLPSKYAKVLFRHRQ